MIPKDLCFLVVDDVQAIRKIITTFLVKKGFENIIMAEDGDEALEVINQRKDSETPVQFVLSDWNMPKMCGIDLLKAVRTSDTESVKNLPFVIVTTNNEKEKVMDAVMCGADNYLVKPVKEEELESKIHKVWKKKNP